MEGVKTVLQERDNTIQIVGESSNGRALCEMVRKKSPDVVILDIRMPEMDGIEAVKEIRTFDSKVRILMLTTFNDQELIARAIQAGADGYLLKDTSVEQLVDAVCSSDHGNIQLSPAAALMMSEKRNRDETKQVILMQKEIPSLSRRERDVFQLLLEGLDNISIAEKLFISEKTVRNHISGIYKVLGVKNRTQSILWAISHGLV